MPLNFDPPLLNSATPWATTKEDIQKLYDSQYTGALTIRTSTTKGYPHDDKIHQYCFVDTEHTIVDHSSKKGQPQLASGGAECISSVNTYVYSPVPLAEYLEIVRDILANRDSRDTKKPIIFSVAGSVSEVRSYYSRIHRLGADTRSRLLMEINLSCPNVSGRQPPAYSEKELVAFLQGLSAEITERQQADQGDEGAGHVSPTSLEIGIKVPPYTYRDQFSAMISALRAVEPCPVSFITSTNTLGSCLLLGDNLEPTLTGEARTGIGGLAGAALHPLALGNVATIRSMLDEHEQLKHISVIGVGGVFDRDSYRHMQCVGADAVGVGTALGSEGLGVFPKILGDAERVDKDMEAFLGGESPNSAKHSCLDEGTPPQTV